jgi:hypothetical protein
MGIEIKVPRAVQIRRLKATGLDARDITKLTGWSYGEVMRALQHKQDQQAAK